MELLFLLMWKATKWMILIPLSLIFYWTYRGFKKYKFKYAGIQCLAKVIVLYLFGILAYSMIQGSSSQTIFFYTLPMNGYGVIFSILLVSLLYAFISAVYFIKDFYKNKITLSFKANLIQVFYQSLKPTYLSKKLIKSQNIAEAKTHYGVV